MTKMKFASLRLSSFTAVAIMMVVIMSQGVFAQKLFTRFSDGAVEIQFGPDFNQVVAQQNILLEGSSFEGNIRAIGKDSIVPLNSRILRYKVNNGSLGAENFGTLSDPQNTEGLIFGTGALRFTANNKKVEFTDFIVKISNPIQLGFLYTVDVEIQGVLYITSTIAGDDGKVQGVQEPLFTGKGTINPLEILFSPTITLANIDLTFVQPPADKVCPPGSEPCPIAEANQREIDFRQ